MSYYRPLSLDNDRRFHTRLTSNNDDSDSDNDDDCSSAASLSSRDPEYPTSPTAPRRQHHLPPVSNYAHESRLGGAVLSSFRAMKSRTGSSHSYEVVGPDGVDKFRNAHEDGHDVESAASGRLSGSGVLVSRQGAGSPLNDAGMHDGLDVGGSDFNFGGLMDRTPEQIWESVSAAAHLDSRERPAGAAGAPRPESQPTSPTSGGRNPQAAYEFAHSPPDHRDSYQYEDVPDHQEHAPQQDVREHRPQTPPSTGADYFKDFDGVHYSPAARATPPPPHLPEIGESPRPTGPQNRHSQYTLDPRRQSQSLANPPREQLAETDSDFVFYPAPVPAVLNLPPLMSNSKNRQSHHRPAEDRSVPYQGPGSAVPGEYQRSAPRRNSRPQLANLPPALRASAFFDNYSNPAPLAPAIQDSSAMATLDKILDASALAPAAAFTDHPLTGTKPNTHMRTPSSANLDHYRTSVAHITHHPGDTDDEGSESEHLSHTPPDHTALTGRTALPTTLLAELESRKLEQKSRTRTAAPTGIHSTLLELDAVAQVQAASRRMRRTHLAWEDPDTAAPQHDDEDIPLGLLYQNSPRPQHNDDNVPLGLLLQKELEDAEPLSHRRDRLRAQQPNHRASYTSLNHPHNRSSSSLPKLPLPGGDDDEESETLAQRAARLRIARESAFGDGKLQLDFSPPSTAPPQIPQEEETLAQRRLRLKKEAGLARLAEEAKYVQAEVRARQAQARQMPVGLVHGAGPASMLRPGAQMMHAQAHMAGARGAGGMGAGVMVGENGEVLNERQREFVERWRESVL